MFNTLIFKIVKAFFWAVMGISVLIAALYFLKIISEDAFIIWAYILVVVGAFFSIAFPILRFAKYPKNGLKALVGIGALGVVLLVGYLMADSTPIVSVIENPYFSDPSSLILADTGIFAAYILFAAAILALLFTGVRSIFNR